MSLDARPDPLAPRRRGAARALVVALLVLCAVALTGQPARADAAAHPLLAAPSGTALWTTATMLDLRSAAASSAPVVASAARDTQVRATGATADGWSEVLVGGVAAWTPSRFLTTARPPWSPARALVTASSLGLRSGPLGDHPVVVTATRGTEVILTGVSRHGWLQAKVADVFAWTPARFLHSLDARGSQIRSGTAVWTTGGVLALRSGPLDSFPVTAKTRAATQATATGRSSDGWLEVGVGGTRAWAPARFMTTSRPVWDPTVVTLSDARATLRGAPSWQGRALRAMAGGDGAIASGVERDGWWQIKVSGTWGWVPAHALVIGRVYDPQAVVDVARSQVGYREPAWRDNPYNDWIGADNAWCAVFVAWVFDRAGYDGWVPRTAHFDDYVAALRRTGVLDTTVSASDLQRGDAVLIDWPPYDGPTHAGIVDRVDGGGVWLYEGNTTSGASGDAQRGVFHRWRDLDFIAASYNPAAYHAATH